MDAITANYATTAANTAGNEVAKNKKSLGAEDFLKLLTVQLQNQDPLEPMKDTDFIAQMANFSSLEQMRELSSKFSNFQEEQQRIAAQAYLGKEVTLVSDATGVVSSVAQSAEGLKVTIGGVEYPISDIRRVTLPTAEPTA